MAHRILVTGASGNIGSEIVKNLRARKADFSAASLGHHEYETDIRSLQLDYAHAGLLETAFEDIHTLFLLIPMAPQMLDFARNVVLAAREAGVRTIVRSSSLGADPHSPYAMKRLQGEIDEVIKESGIPSVFVMPNTFMQNFVTYYGDSIRQGALYLSQGEGRTSFVDVRDIAEVMTEILLDTKPHAGHFYTVTGGRAISNEEALAIISQTVGRHLAYVPITEAAALAAMRKVGTDPWLMDMLLSLHRAAREGQGAIVTETVQKFTGHVPRTFESFCREKSDEWRSRDLREASL